MPPYARPAALIVTRNFPPLTGGMERLTFHTYEALREDYDCALVGPSGCEAFCLPDTQVASCELKPLARFLTEAWIKSYKMAQLLRPQVIIAASGVTAPTAVSIAKRFGSAAVTVVHGLDLIVSHPIYQTVFIPAIRRSNFVIANSSNTAWLARKAGVKADKIEVLHPGVTLPPAPGSDEFANQSAASQILQELEGRTVLLSVGRLVPRKGLVEFIDCAMPEIVKREPNVILLIAGGAATDALKRDTKILAAIRCVVEKRHLQEHVRLLGRVASDQTLSALYRRCNVFVMPLVPRDDDVEGFGMVAVEAAAHGVPTAGFSVGGLPDAVENGRSGLLVTPGDYPALTDAIFELLNNESCGGITPITCRDHAERFSWARYKGQLGSLYGRLVTAYDKS